jgi:hypothetical protein
VRASQFEFPFCVCEPNGAARDLGPKAERPVVKAILLGSKAVRRETQLCTRCIFIAVGVRLLRLSSLMVTAFVAFVSVGVLGASLLSFDKLKMLMLLNCQQSDVFIPLLGVQMSVGMAHNLTMVAAICSLLLLPVSCVALGYLAGRSR